MSDVFHLGFTGTRHGMTGAQLDAVTGLVDQMAGLGPIVAHHGMCIGADAEFHAVCRRWTDARIVGHPGPNDDLARRAQVEVDEQRPGKPHHARNRDIVTESWLVIGAPREMAENRFGGTWGTVRTARDLERPLALVLPDGRITWGPETFLERAAIREFLGGYSRAEAERLAVDDVRQMARDRRNAQNGGIR